MMFMQYLVASMMIPALCMQRGAKYVTGLVVEFSWFHQTLSSPLWALTRRGGDESLAIPCATVYGNDHEFLRWEDSGG